MKKNHPIHINIPIAKVDEDQRMVWGYATVEEVDAHGEIIGYEASKKAFSNWVGNIREMHGPVAIGKSIEVRFDDEAKGVWLGSYISESADGENAWIKVKEGILQAYSIGGNIKDFKMVKMDGDDHLMVTDYDLFETSLVDNPACPSATLQVVKSTSRGLRRTEQLQKGDGRQPAWWEQRFNFSPTQRVIKSSPATYNGNSMIAKQRALAKDIWSAYELIDLASCLAGYIWMEAYEGEDVTALSAALETIKAAAADEISEPSEFPEPLAVAIENACKALNITKVEELKKMAEDKKNLEKAGVNVVDGDPRDASATTVSEVIAGTAPTKPAATAVPKKTYAADGKTTTSKSEDGDPVAITVNKPAVEPPVTVTPPEPAGDPTPEPAPSPDPDPAADPAPAADPPAPVENAASAGDLSKSTEQGDLVKSILAGVDGLIAKAVDPLKEEIETLKKSPAPSKRAGSFMDVEKTASGSGDSEFEQTKSRFDELMVKANDFAAHPEKGSIQDRVAIGVELRKLSRAMDPASRAQHAAIRASFNTSGQPQI